MTVIAMKRTDFTVTQYNNVSNIAYNAETKVYTITYGNSQTTTFSSNNYVISVLFS